MNNLDIFLNLGLFLAYLVSFIYAVVKFAKPKKALYLKIISAAFGCMLLGRLYNVVHILTIGGLLEGFNPGLLGVVGGFMFLFSANYGQIDSLIDDDSRTSKEYCLISLSAPLVIALGYISIAIFSKSLETKIVTALVLVVIMLDSYYHLKHLIIPDVQFGIVRSIRKYNFLALVFAVLNVADITLVIRGANIPLIVVDVLMGVVALIMPYFLEKGVNSWSVI